MKSYKACYESKTAEYDKWGDIENIEISDSIALAYVKSIEIVKVGGLNGN